MKFKKQQKANISDLQFYIYFSKEKKGKEKEILPLNILKEREVLLVVFANIHPACHLP